MQRKNGDFHNEFYIKQIEELAYHRSYYKIIGKHHVANDYHSLWGTDLTRYALLELKK